MWTTVALVVTVLVIIFLRANKRPTGLPPGPFCLPIVGSALQILWSTPNVTFKKFAETYGGILSFRVFDKWTVLVSDPALMKAGLADPAASGRSDYMLATVRDTMIKGRECPALGIIGNSGEVWKRERRFTLRTMRDLGFGRSTVEPIMQEELEELLQIFRRQQGKKVDVALLFNRSIVNVIWAITIGKRYSYDDERLDDLVEKVNTMIQSFNPFHPVARFRWIKKLLPNLAVLRKTEGNLADMLKFLVDEMEVYIEQLGDQEDLGCYVGAYLNELRKLKPGEENDETTLSMDNLKANIMELFLAGSETTSSTLRWALYLLTTNQDVQQRMQKEMDNVVGRENNPSLSHMDKLPYTMATAYEVQRVANLLLFAVPHRALDDVSLGGYRIPKGTDIMFNLSHGHSDPTLWKGASKFRPEHFLTEDGKVFKPDQFMPFGSGKRVCLGESLARLEIFFFLTSLMHRFSWRLADEKVTWEQSTFINRPPNFRVYAVSRDEKTK